MIGEVVVDLRDPNVIRVRCPASAPHEHASSWRQALEILEQHPHHDFEYDRFLSDEGILELVFVRLDKPDPLDALTVAY